MNEKTADDLEREACRAPFSHLREPNLLTARSAEALDWCHTNGARILYPQHEDYPFRDGVLESPPPFLALWGEPCWRERKCLSVVGSREPSAKALEWMETHLAEFIRFSRAVIVSGGARGIDQKAHRLAMRAGSPTVVFLPSGLQCPYPDEWRLWKDEVVERGGAIISHYHPYQEIRRSHFEARNRLIAAMGKMLLVVEARRRSGSVMTARLATELSRTVCVLPGHPTDVRAGGTIDLLFDGALPVRDSNDLRALFNLETQAF